MKKWETPEVEMLDVQNTLHGPQLMQHYDDIRVDNLGSYWPPFVSGSVEPCPVDETTSK